MKSYQNLYIIKNIKKFKNLHFKIFNKPLVILKILKIQTDASREPNVDHQMLPLGKPNVDAAKLLLKQMKS